MVFKFDIYSLQARLVPALLVIAPVILGLVAWFPQKFQGWNLLVALVPGLGLAVLLAHLARDLGKKKEHKLFAKWGGIPTTQFLRHRDESLDATTRRRYHGKLAALAGLIALPLFAEEQEDPEKADHLYNSVVRLLREKTRDKNRFGLVFAENVNYGLRRNLWGMKPAGILVSLIGLTVCIGAVLFDYVEKDSIQPIAIISVIINTTMLTWWVLRITPSWVRLAADAYADRLLATCDDL